MSRLSLAVPPARPRLRGVGHAVAAGSAPFAAAAIIARASGAAERGAAVVYGVTLTAVLVASAAYHRGSWSGVARRRMKALDHTTIFAFIVGSHGPLAVVALGLAGRVAFLGSVAVLALAGAVVKLRQLDRAGGPADALYGITTLWVLLIAGPLARALSGADLGLLAGGTLMYSLSAGCLARRWPDPAPATFGYHELAHTFVLLGVACHYLLVWRVFG